MRLFHYHLVTSKVREVEARYIGKLGFTLVARHGRIDEDTTSFESGHGWEELDELGFKLRLSELERGAGNGVVQPGQWEMPRLRHPRLRTRRGRVRAAPARPPRLRTRRGLLRRDARARRATRAARPGARRPADVHLDECG